MRLFVVLVLSRIFHPERQKSPIFVLIFSRFTVLIQLGMIIITAYRFERFDQMENELFTGSQNFQRRQLFLKCIQKWLKSATEEYLLNNLKNNSPAMIFGIEKKRTQAFLIPPAARFSRLCFCRRKYWEQGGLSPEGLGGLIHPSFAFVFLKGGVSEGKRGGSIGGGGAS